MDKTQIEFFRTALAQRLDELLSQAYQTMSELVSQDIQEIEYLDRASAEIGQSFKLRIKSRESLLIKKIRQALERIEDESYGICESCGEEISIKRLNARPVTAKCLDCKEEEEKEELLMQ